MASAIAYAISPRSRLVLIKRFENALIVGELNPACIKLSSREKQCAVLVIVNGIDT